MHSLWWMVVLWKYPSLLMLHGKLCGSEQVGAVFVSDTWLLPFATLFPLFLFIWFVLPGSRQRRQCPHCQHCWQRGAASQGSGWPGHGHERYWSFSLPGYQINTLRPWLFLSFKVLGLEELCIFLHLNIFWDCGKSWTLKWISDDPHLMGLILTDGRTLDAGGGQEMLKWTYSLEYHRQTLSPVSPPL